MNNPTSQQTQAVADTFKRLAIDNPQGTVEMNETDLPSECDTFACHAGWYAHANKERLDDVFSSDYSNGARMMAEDLGFDHQTDLEAWARLNPDLWGNKKGAELFTYDCAFTTVSDSISEEPDALAMIGEHWQGVTDRLKHLEKTGEIIL